MLGLGHDLVLMADVSRLGAVGLAEQAVAHEYFKSPVAEQERGRVAELIVEVKSCKDAKAGVGVCLDRALYVPVNERGENTAHLEPESRLAA